MIITADEYYNKGFTAENDEVLKTCLERAEYTLYALTQGKIDKALAAGGKAADYVKEAACFQTYKLVKEYETGFGGMTEKVSIGDFSYSSSAAAGNTDTVDMSMQAVRLLKAAGCLYGGTEVRL